MAAALTQYSAVAERARRSEIDALLIENELALTLLRERDHRRQSALLKGIATYKIEILQRCINQQAGAHQAIVNLVRQDQSAALQSLQSAHEAELHSTVAQEQSTTTARIEEIQREHQQRLAAASAELERRLSVAQQHKTELEAQLCVRNEMAERLNAEVVGLRDLTNGLQAEVAEAQVEVRRAKDETSSLSRESDVQKMRDEKHISVRDDIWRKKLEIWKKSHESDQIKWANENVDLQLRIATLEKQLALNRSSQARGQAAEVMPTCTVSHSEDAEDMEAVAHAAGEASSSSIITTRETSLTYTTSPSCEERVSVAVAVPGERDAEARVTMPSAAVTKKRKGSVVQTAHRSLSLPNKKAKAAQPPKHRPLDPVEEAPEVQVAGAAAFRAGIDAPVERPAAKKKRLLSNAKKHSFDPFKRTQQRAKTSADSDDDDESTTQPSLLSTFVGQAQASSRGPRQRTIDSLNALIGNFAAKK